MYFLYLDESGSNTTHFVLLGLAIPATSWRIKSTQIGQIKSLYQLSGKEIHTGWMLSRYIEQKRIPGFETLSYDDRREAVIAKQKAALHWLSTSSNRKKLSAKKKEIKKIDDYVHLTFNERKECIRQLLDLIGTWTDSRLFAEAVNLTEYNLEIDYYENAFTQVISRFDNFLRKTSKPEESDYHGVIVQDQNKAVAHRLRDLMKEFHKRGTIWTKYTHIIETPFFSIAN